MAKPDTTGAGPNPASGPAAGAGSEAALPAGSRARSHAKPPPAKKITRKHQKRTDLGGAATDSARVAGTDSKPAGAAPATPRSVRLTAKRIQDFHAQAASRFRTPELALSYDEASELQGSIETLGTLTAVNFASPLFIWLGVLWSVAWIYGSRMAEISARKATAAERDPAPPPKSVSAANGATRPVPAAVRPAPQPNDLESILIPPIAGETEGLTPNIPGVPITTAEERWDKP